MSKQRRLLIIAQVVAIVVVGWLYFRTNITREVFGEEVSYIVSSLGRKTTYIADMNSGKLNHVWMPGAKTIDIRDDQSQVAKENDESKGMGSSYVSLGPEDPDTTRLQKAFDKVRLEYLASHPEAKYFYENRGKQP